MRDRGSYPDQESMTVLEWIEGEGAYRSGSMDELDRVGELDDIDEASAGCNVRILAEGDSWFAYPGYADTLEKLRKLTKPPIKRIAHHGETLAEMLAAGPREKLYTKLQEQHYQLLLFSAGGNDILDSWVLSKILKPKSSGATGEALLDMEEFHSELEKIAFLYMKFLDELPKLSRNPDIKVVTHTYDYPWPRNARYKAAGIGVKGPWIYPIMTKKRGISDMGERRAIIITMMQRFKAVLNDLAAYSGGRLIVVDTQGTLSTRADVAEYGQNKAIKRHWQDEIHPTPMGAKLIASKIYEQGIKPLLPACAL